MRRTANAEPITKPPRKSEEKTGGALRKDGDNSMECYNCKAKEHCIAAAQPGSVICMMNILKYGGTHADDAPPRQASNFCQFCGQPLRVIGTERFCNNVNCQNRYINV